MNHLCNLQQLTRDQVLVHPCVISVQSRVPVHWEELHSPTTISLPGSLLGETVGFQHQLCHFTKVINCDGHTNKKNKTSSTSYCTCLLFPVLHVWYPHEIQLSPNGDVARMIKAIAGEHGGCSPPPYIHAKHTIEALCQLAKISLLTIASSS